MAARNVGRYRQVLEEAVLKCAEDERKRLRGTQPQEGGADARPSSVWRFDPYNGIWEKSKNTKSMLDATEQASYLTESNNDAYVYRAFPRSTNPNRGA